MTTKQLQGLMAPDGSYYVTVTDGVGNLASLGSITNSRLAKTSNYTVQNVDKRFTIALGGNSFYNLTFNAASGYDADFMVLVLNEDLPPPNSTNIFLWVSTFAYSTNNLVIGFNGHQYKALSSTTGNDPTTDGGVHWQDLGAQGRAKSIVLTGGTTFKLYPGQSILVFNQNNVWETLGRSRWQVPVDTSFYIDPLGSNSNDGMAPTTGAFLTLQGAYDAINPDIDFNNKNIYLQMGIGTFAPLAIAFPWLGGGSLIIQGYSVLDGSGHFDSKISANGTPCVNITATCCGGIQLGLLTLQTTGNCDGLVVTAPNSVYIASVEFAGLGAVISRGVLAGVSGATIIANGAMWITGLSTNNFEALGGGYIQLTGQTITLASSVSTAGQPTGNIVLTANDGGVIEASGITWGGTGFSNNASVFKYFLQTNGILNTGNTIAAIPGALSLAQSGGVTDQAGTFTATTPKQFVALNTMLVAAGADGQTFTFPAVTDTVAGLGTAQTFSALNTYSTPVRFTPVTVAALPAAVAGKTGMVSDSTVAIGAGLGLAPIGGGANVVPVFCDQTPAWKIG